MSASRRRAFALFVRHRPAYLAGVVCLLITSGLNLSVPALLGTAFAGLGGEGEPSRLGRLLGIPEGGLAPDGQSAFLLRIAVAIVGVGSVGLPLAATFVRGLWGARHRCRCRASRRRNAW